MGIVMTIVLMVVVAALTTATILTTESAMRDAKAAEEKMVVIVKNKIPMPEEKLERMRLSVIEQLKQGNVIAHPSAFEVELKIIRADEGTEKLTDQIAEELKEKYSEKEKKEDE